MNAKQHCLSQARIARGERGIAFAYAAIAMLAMVGVAALTVDFAFHYSMLSRLQVAADSAALAGAAKLPDLGEIRREAKLYARKNMPRSEHGAVLKNADIWRGNWNRATRTFTPDMEPYNAVRVIARRDSSMGNPSPFFFAQIFGFTSANLTREAIAEGVDAAGPSTTEAASRFIFDDDLIDSDVPSIEELAHNLGMDKEDLISDLDGDWFLDIPAEVDDGSGGMMATELIVPTGQHYDEGLFDITHVEFPFAHNNTHSGYTPGTCSGNAQNGETPTFSDFLNYNEDSSSWRYDCIDKDDLDPLQGVSPVRPPLNEAVQHYQDNFVDPNYCQLSPVYKSDVSELDPDGTTPQVNALGERRGLLRFSIIEVIPRGTGGDNWEGKPYCDSGSSTDLPCLKIRICDPTDPENWPEGPGSGGGPGTTAGKKRRLVD